MQRTGAMQAAANVLRKLFPAVLPLCLAVSGCHNTCYSGSWNGNSSTVTVNNPCPLTTATGTVIVQMGAASAPPAASVAFPPPLASPRASPKDVQHIFVTLLGIEAHPSTTADEDSSGWQELAPDLATHPLQLDLLTPLTALGMYGDSRSPGLSASANVTALARAFVPGKVPADEFRLMRLRLMPRNPSPEDLAPESNACGNVGWNCIVFADRSVQPLEFADAASEFRIAPGQGAGSIFRVLPGETIHLSIEFDAASSVYFPSNAKVRLVPAFKVASRTSSPAVSAP